MLQSKNYDEKFWKPLWEIISAYRKERKKQEKEEKKKERKLAWEHEI